MIAEKRKGNTMPVREYGVFGPFDVPRSNNGLVANTTERRGFWERVEETAEGLSDANGFYIFGIRAGQGSTPWYVGQATNTFRKECFEHHKLTHYNEVLAGHKRGTPILLLLARRTPTGRFKLGLSKREADSLEALLIDRCLHANEELRNTQGTAIIREARIPGLLNSPQGAPSSSVKFLRQLLG